MKHSILILLIIFGIWACEKEPTSPGNGGYGYQLLKIGFLDWEAKEVRRFSGAKGIIIDGYVHGGGLKSASIIMIDTLTKSILYQKSSNTFIANLFRCQDTIYLLNVTDTINAKITLDGKDENEMGSTVRSLKIGK